MLFFLLACSDPPPTPLRAPPPKDAAPAPLRIGWQTTWATQGQLAAILVHTDVLPQEGYAPTLVGFSYGGPLNEGALAGGVDALFTADQPALILASKSPSWHIIGRLMYNRVGTLAPADSKRGTAGDLKGATVAVPFGAAAQRETLRAARAVGLDPRKDLSLVNLGLEEIQATVAAGAKEGRWGTLDAVSVWDPALATMELSGSTRTLTTGVVTSVVMMDGRYLAEHPGADAALLDALATAYVVYREDPTRADRWFEAEAKTTFAPGVLSKAAEVEPNLQKDAPVRVTLSGEDRQGIADVATFMVEAGLIGNAAAVTTAIQEPAGDKLSPLPREKIAVTKP